MLECLRSLQPGLQPEAAHRLDWKVGEEEELSVGRSENSFSPVTGILPNSDT
jgi:hypothetical protein